MARYGKYCRTRTLHEDDMLGDIYLEGHQLADGKWIVNRVTAVEIEDKDNPGQTETARDVRRIAMNIGMLHAIAQLSGFEHGQPNPNVAFVGETAEELGNTHFMAFAEREGFVFDINKRPHDTIDGQAVDSGRFRDADLDRAALRAKQAANEHPELADGSASQYKTRDKKAEGGGLVIPDASLGDVFAQNAGRVDIDRTLDNMKDIGILDDFVKYLGEFRRNLSYCMRSPFDYHEKYGELWNTRTAYIDLAFKALGKAEKKLSEYNTAEHRDEYADLSKFTEKARFAAYVAYAQALYADMGSTAGDNRKHLKKMKWTLKKARSVNSSNGDAFMEPNLIDQVAVVDERPETPKMIGEFISNYNAWRKQAVSSATEKQNRRRVMSAGPGR